MEFKKFNDEKVSQNRYYDDDFDNDKIPSFNYSFAEDEGRVLTFNIGKDVGYNSKKYLLEILESCWGIFPIKIQIKDYTDGLKASISGVREKLEDDPEVNILSETEGEDHDGNDDSDTLSAVSSKSTWLTPKLVEFEKTSDLIILHNLPYFVTKLKNCAASNQVILDYTDKGILLKGESEDGFKMVEKMIRKMYDDLLCFKEFKDQSSDKIKVISNALRNVNDSLAKKFNLEFVHTITNEAYYKTYSELARKVPALAQKLSKKLKKTNLRIVLIQSNIRKKPEIVAKFRDTLLENSKPFVQKFDIESSDPVDKKISGDIIRLASQNKLYIKHEAKKILDNQTFKIKNVHQFTVMSYYSNEAERKIIQKRAQALKEQITKMIRPNLLYHFIAFDDRSKYYTFVLPEIQNDLKENNVQVTIVRSDNRIAPQRGEYFKPQRPEFALNIQGDKTNTRRILKKIGDLMRQVASYTYYPRLQEFVARNVKIFGYKENEQFFLNFFNEIYSECPNVKLMHCLKSKANPQNTNNQKNNADKTPGEGDPRKGKPYGKPHGQYEEKELVIQIIYKNNNDLNRVKEILDQFFVNLVLDRITLEKKFSELLSEAATKKGDFEKQYNILTNDFFDNIHKKDKVDMIGQKENVQTAKDFIKNINNAVKPITVQVNIESRLLMNALRPEIKKLAPGVMCRFLKSPITLFGEPTKVQQAKTNIVNFLNAKKNESYQTKMENMPNSYLKTIEQRRKDFFELQRKYQVDIRLMKPTSTKLHAKVGLENKAGKSLIVVQGDITKIQVDAIVNSTNLKFGDATINQGVAKAIMDKAGEEFVEECQTRGELKESEAFTSGSGNLESCKSIINVCPPLYKSDSNLSLALNKLKDSVKNVLEEAIRYNFETLALPFISAGNYGIPSQEAIICIIEELATALFLQNSGIKRILLCEIDEQKLKTAEQKIKSITSADQANEYVPKYQWQWEDDGRVWTSYDLQVNRQIDYAFSQGQKTIEIKFPVPRAIGTHIIDIPGGILTRKSTGQRSRIERKIDGWYENEVKMSDGVSEIIDLKQGQGNKTFEIFLNEYTIDLTNMIQTNKQTQFTRRIQKIPIASSQVAHKFTIPNVTLMQQASLTQGKIFGEIIIEGFSKDQVEKTKTQIQQLFESLMTQVEVDINPKIGKENLSYLKNIIERNRIKEMSGEIKEGRKVKLQGLKSAVIKIQDRIRTVNQVLGESQSLPANWAQMDDEFGIVPLTPQDNEWNIVLQRFNQTLFRRSIIAIQRIQNIKFWMEYCQEKQDLGKIHERAGFKPVINEEFLWHGTSNTHPSSIYGSKDVFFDTQHANDGMWGRGIYFAVNASYSDGFATHTPSNTRLFMLCRVMIGDTIELKSDSSLRKPPERPGAKEKILYDSVKGNTGGSDVYIIYRTRRAYPEYLIEYK